MANIAVKSAGPRVQVLGTGPGWTVCDVVCTAGPQDRPFEEQHSRSSVSIVLGGTFQYRSPSGRELMAPGCWMLGNRGDCFTCGHEHGLGDRCVSFSFTPEVFERLSYDSLGRESGFRVPRLPPVRSLAPLSEKVTALLAGAADASYEELSLQVAAQALRLEQGFSPRDTEAEASSLARVTRVIRMIDNDPEARGDLSNLAAIARLSPYHFLRMFEGITGTTPHQYLLRIRLQRAALRLRTEPTRILEIALGCGFGDVSNFNRTFQAEFGVSPRRYRREA